MEDCPRHADYVEVRSIRRVSPVGVLVLVLTAALWTAPAAGQETVEFQLKLARGEVLHATLTASADIAVQVADQRQSTNFAVEGREVTRILAVDPDGTMTVEVVFDDLRISAGGRTEEAIDAPITLKVRPDGRVVDRQTGSYPDEDFPFGFPGRPARLGERWTRQTRVDEGGITGQGTVTYTLAGVERAAEGRVARVTYTLEGQVSGADIGPLPPDAQSRASGTIRGTGELFWAVERGRLLRQSDDTTFEAQVEVTAQGQTINLALTLQAKAQRAPLPAERVTIPAVAPEFLIAPGKGIGPFTLDQSVADLTGRLGNPTRSDPTPGLRAPIAFWTNGLAALVDSTDGNKVVGLEISDRHYRTDKGITFGSSQGAVLMTYGMSPPRQEITMPNLGGARILIYNDLGIAFAITSDKQHAEAGPGHAPVGAVDWITVFPPGQAGRIYSLP